MGQRVMSAVRFRSTARVWRTATLCLLVLLMGVSSRFILADEPALPPGLTPAPKEKKDEPALPPGLTPSPREKKDEPALPPGLGKPATEKPKEEPKEPFRLPFDLSGFWDTRIGTRTQHDRHQKHMSMAETRLQVEIERQLELLTLKVTNDFLLDAVQDDWAIDLEKGRGWIDLREAFVAFTPADFIDVKAGRQVLTWGTGDRVFINDLFPKDWNSFLIGRNMEYLKAPSDALKASVFSPVANLDVVYTPAFDSDRFVDGSRITFYNFAVGARTGRSMRVREERPQHWFHDDEIALRLYKTLKGAELAAYAYRGFWKSPAGTNPVNGKARFPDLDVLGASARGNFFRGIAHTEFGYYRSREDTGGRNPLIRNGEVRALVGYEQEIATDFTAGVQWYLEHMLDYNNYRRALPAGVKRIDEARHVVTLSLTKLMMGQNLRLSLFTFYSPTDNDAFLIPNANYKIDDHWSAELGANLFAGQAAHTFFGQFAPNTSVFAAARYSF